MQSGSWPSGRKAAVLKLDGLPVEDEIASIVYTDDLNGAENQVMLGSSAAAYVVVRIKYPSVSYVNRRLSITIGGVPLGTFTVARASGGEGEVTLTAYDDLYTKLGYGYFPRDPAPTTALGVLEDICAQAGMVLGDTGDLPDAAVTNITSGYTMGEMAGYMAALLGGHAHVGRDGTLQVKWYRQTDKQVGPDDYYAGKLVKNDGDFTVGKLSCAVAGESEESGQDPMTLTAGAGGTGIAISNPWMTQAVLDGLFQTIGGMTWRPLSVTMAGDARVEAGDLLTVTDQAGNSYSVPVMRVIHTWDGGMTTEITAFGASETEEDVQPGGSLAVQMERYTAGMASFKKLYAQDLTATNATIQALRAEDADIRTLAAGKADIADLDAANAAIEQLQAVDAEIQQAIIDKASVEDLTATNATLTNVTADVANINTVLAGNAGVGNLQAIHLTGDNAVIDDATITDAMIAGLTAGKLTAGTIWTNLVTIASQSGNLSIVDNTIQIVDDAGTVRVQIGKDAAGDYNLALWGADGALLWDASGVYAAGLHDGIIKDVAIADDANINQSKIDMDSVAERLNEDGTITVDAGRVTIDDTTLDVAYRSVTTKIDDSVTHVEIQYALSPSQTVPPSDGWAVITPEPQEGQYLWQKTVTTYGDGSIEESLPTCLSGMAGKDGEDATVLRIDSSRGTVFKNSAVSTVLSVVIYHGSLRITDKAGLTAAFGSGAYLEWSWQRMDESTFGVISAEDSRITNDGFCFTLSPDDVDTKVVFQCSLNI